MPEILLSVFSIVGGLSSGEDPDELGPMGIVGSAAFNLFVIGALSIMTVTDGPKHILDVGVFLWTAFASTFAYVWFWIVLGDSLVDIEEAVATLVFFGVLCLVALGLDKWTSAKVRAKEHEANVLQDASKYILRKLQTAIGTLAVVKLGLGDEVAG